MSNFQELQAHKLTWKLNNDEELMKKMHYMQDNVLASSHLIQNSMQELNRAINAAGTTLENAINAFNQLNHTKFLENVSLPLLSMFVRSSKTSTTPARKQKLIA